MSGLHNLLILICASERTETCYIVNTTLCSTLLGEHGDNSAADGSLDHFEIARRRRLPGRRVRVVVAVAVTDSFAVEKMLQRFH